MDSRRISAAIGFALLIGCVIGIVILIHNSETSRSSSNRIGKSNGREGDIQDFYFVSKKKENGFSNDPNYRSSQPTMQEMNELADELHRILSPKPKASANSNNKPRNGTVTKSVTKKKDNSSSMPVILPDNHKPFQPLPVISSVAGAKKAVISAVNYSHIPNINNHAHHNHRGNQNGPSAGIHTKSPNQQQLQPSSPTGTGGGRRNGVMNQMSAADIQAVSEAGGGLEKEKGVLAGASVNDFYKTPWLPSTIPLPSPGMPHPMMMSNITSQNFNHRRHPPFPQYNQRYHYNQQIHQQHQYQQRRPPPHISSNHRANMPFLPSAGINMTRPNYNNRFSISAKSPVAESDVWEEHTYEDSWEDVERDEGDNSEWDEYNQDPDSRDKTTSGDEEEADKNNAEPRDFIADFQTLFELANHLYTSPNNNNISSNSGSVFQGFLKVINETIQRGNNSGLLAELNEMYGGRLKRNRNGTIAATSTNISRQNWELVGSEKDRQPKNQTMTPYETSLTAFVFMSFGVFLLNQIHNFVQKSPLSPTAPGAHHSNNGSVEPAIGRALLDKDIFDWYTEPFLHGSNEARTLSNSLLLGKEPSSLDILFDEPDELKTKINGKNEKTENGTGESSSTDAWNGRSANDNNPNSFSSSRHINNMFRAFLNIVNAYTKNSQAMECIWSLYCQDLDTTAGKRGLYGVAARINSVGLRLIMNQIPPSLTLDVILRSLVGWDGLPCRKMFPACAVNNGTISVVNDVNDDMSVVVEKNSIKK